MTTLGFQSQMRRAAEAQAESRARREGVTCSVYRWHETWYVRSEAEGQPHDGAVLEYVAHPPTDTPKTQRYTDHLQHLVYAYQSGVRGAPNLPIAIGAENKRRWIEQADYDNWIALTTTTGQRIEMRRADCGSECRCAAEWRPIEAP